MIKTNAMAIRLCLLFIILQLDSVVSECNVNYCDSDYCNDTICTQCHPGYYYYTGPHCEKCFLYCKGCNDSQCYSCFTPGCSTDICDHANCVIAGCSGNSTVICNSCPNGFYYSKYRCYRCNNVNCKCTSASNCDECLPGYYGISNFCNNHCPSTCFECISSKNCTKCTAGKYGEACEYDCTTTCQDGTCDKESGNCTEGCLAGQFLSLHDRCLPCPSRCITCSSYDNCTSCTRPHYWGPACKYDCTGCYEICNISHGCSSGCSDSNYYQTYNTDRNGYDCRRCPEECRSCTSVTECHICVHGLWGSACQYNCTGCGGECDKDTGCSSGCLFGHYPEFLHNGYTCVRCPQECDSCTNGTRCLTCAQRRWGIRCQYICSGCRGDCDIVTGHCESGCLPGYYQETLTDGNRCQECVDNCTRCSSATRCLECGAGYFPDTKGSCRTCSENCIEGMCDVTNGHCSEGCLSGFGAPRCDQRCPNGCSTCEQSNVSICRHCEVNLFGTKCEKNCGVNCKRLGQGFPVCKNDDGACVNGCENGHWGRQCSLACDPGCLDNVCNETNGGCLQGCKVYYYGDTCNKKCEGKLDYVCETDISDVSNGKSEFQETSSDNNSNNGATIGLAVTVCITVLLLAASIAANIVLLKKLRGLALQEAGKMSANTTPGGQLDTNPYQDLSRRGPDERTYSSLTQEYENNF